MAGRVLTFGRARLVLPEGFGTEIDLVSRGAPEAGYHPNLRITIRDAVGAPPLAEIAKAYEEQLRASIAGEAELEFQRPRAGRGPEPMVELSLRVKLSEGRVAKHRALIAAADGMVVIAAGSWREGDPNEADAETALQAALMSLRFEV